MTPRQICTLALKMCGALGVGQTALAEDTNDTFTLLNMMLGQWSQKRWLVYHLIDVTAPISANGTITLGAGGTINTPRPDRIEAAFARYAIGSGPIDYPLEIIESRADWNAIGLKGMTGLPSAVFYDSGYPLGTVYVFPQPAVLYEIHLSLKQALPSFGNLSDDLNLPPEYEEAILYNLAVRLFPMYGLSPRADVVTLAKVSLNTIRNSNTQIANLRMPAGLPGRRFMGRGGGLAYGVGLPPGNGNGDGGTVTPPPPPGDNSAVSPVLNVGVLNRMVLAKGSGDFASQQFSAEFLGGTSP